MRSLKDKVSTILLAFSLVSFIIMVSSSPLPSNEKVKETHIIKDETGSKRISHRHIADSTPESSNFNDNLSHAAAQQIHRSAVPDIPVTSSDANSDHSIELQEGGQTFFPSFANLFQSRHQPLGHSRPIYSPEGAYSQRPSPLRQLLTNFEVPSFGGFKSNDYVKSASSQPSDSSGILGSGNFGVIPGGTFFSESSDVESQYSDNFDSQYNNGHGRPSFYYNPRPAFNEEQFANFRDFADINAPSNSAFSHYVVVYANKNATIEEVQEGNAKSSHHHIEDEPKNIIERLEQIDKEKEESTSKIPEEFVAKKSKLSKSKLKLSLLKGKKYGKGSVVKKKNTESEAKDLSDPLLALS